MPARRAQLCGPPHRLSQDRLGHPWEETGPHDRGSVALKDVRKKQKHTKTWRLSDMFLGCGWVHEIKEEMRRHGETYEGENTTHSPGAQ